jgi:hypothetical protein
MLFDIQVSRQRAKKKSAGTNPRNGGHAKKNCADQSQSEDGEVAVLMCMARSARMKTARERILYRDNGDLAHRAGVLPAQTAVASVA